MTTTTADRQKTLEQMRRIFRPRGVAVVGASSTPGKLGYAIVENLKNGGFEGGISMVLGLGTGPPSLSSSTLRMVRPPQAGCSPRIPRTACSSAAAVRRGEPRGRRDLSARPAAPSCA